MSVLYHPSREQQFELYKNLDPDNLAEILQSLGKQILKAMVVLTSTVEKFNTMLPSYLQILV